MLLECTSFPGIDSRGIQVKEASKLRVNPTGGGGGRQRPGQLAIVKLSPHPSFTLTFKAAVFFYWQPGEECFYKETPWDAFNFGPVCFTAGA